MADTANVRSIQALTDLRTALLRFTSDSQQVLQAVAVEVRRTREWLAERQRHWQGEVSRRQEILRRARADLARCQASGYRDPETGAYIPLNCSREEATLVKAQVYLAQAEDALRTVLEATRLVERAAAEYERQAGRLAGLLGTEVPNSTALLQRSVERLEAYVATAPPLAAGPAPTTVSGLDQIGLAAMAVLGIPAPDPLTGGGTIETSASPEIEGGGGGPESRG